MTKGALHASHDCSIRSEREQSNPFQILMPLKGKSWSGSGSGTVLGTAGPYNCRMPESVKIDLGSALPYLEQRFWEIVGRDAASAELAEWFKNLQSIAISQSAVVQCVGMRQPV